MTRKPPVRDLDFEIEAGPVDTQDLLVEIDGDPSATAAERKIPKKTFRSVPAGGLGGEGEVLGEGLTPVDCLYAGGYSGWLHWLQWLPITLLNNQVLVANVANVSAVCRG